MPRLVISTVGTSLLTNCIDRDIDPDNWLKRLQDTANYTDKTINKHYPDISKIITDLEQRAEENLYGDELEISEIRESCAELNGIYGLYDENLEQGVSDTHILITTDTAQGIIAGKMIKDFLKGQGINNISTHIQSELSLMNSNVFSEGIAKLIPYIRNTIEEYPKRQYEICFNLVGGFRALQGYFNTIGMFYADKIIYVFEGSNEVITIPRLPITVDIEQVEPCKVQLAMMEQGSVSKSWKELKKVSPEWILANGQEIKLSPWGQLIWEQCKTHLLSQDDLLKFPRIAYKKNNAFTDDYKKITTNKDKVKLQEVIAKVAVLLEKSNGDTSILKKDGGLQYERYTDAPMGNIYHFRVTKKMRVSCEVIGNTLELRYYGTHDYVHKKEGIKKTSK